MNKSNIYFEKGADRLKNDQDIILFLFCIIKLNYVIKYRKKLLNNAGWCDDDCRIKNAFNNNSINSGLGNIGMLWIRNHFQEVDVKW